jgi:purine-binding chemotaxis protein CheW
LSELHVVFKVGQGEYALPARDVIQMESFSGSTPVPGARPWVSGIIQIRGRVVPVLDVRARFGLPKHDLTLDSRVVVTTHGERAVGLLVDSAREVLKIDLEKFKPPPQLVLQEAQGMVKAVAQVGARLLILLDLSKLIGEE